MKVTFQILVVLFCVLVFMVSESAYSHRPGYVVTFWAVVIVFVVLVVAGAVLKAVEALRVRLDVLDAGNQATQAMRDVSARMGKPQ